MRAAAVLALLAILLAGCGQTGPLYQPPPERDDSGAMSERD